MTAAQFFLKLKFPNSLPRFHFRCDPLKLLSDDSHEDVVRDQLVEHHLDQVRPPLGQDRTSGQDFFQRIIVSSSGQPAGGVRRLFFVPESVRLNKVKLE
jgi:hypothetical protein